MKDNPVKIVGSMGSSKAKEMLFWTREEYQMFKEAMKEKPVSYYAFEILYWCGIRCGELLALKVANVVLASGILVMPEASFLLHHLRGDNVIWVKMMLLELKIDRFQIYDIIYVKMIDDVQGLAYNGICWDRWLYQYEK